MLHAAATPFALLGLVVLFHPVGADLSASVTTCKDPATTWWNNANGDSPCKVAQQVLQQCSQENLVSALLDNPASPQAVCRDSAQASCCCNSVAYSLIEACWSCQQNLTEPSSSLRRPTYSEFLQCPYQNSPDLFPSYLKGIAIPEWAFIAWDTTDTWMYAIAEQNASTTESVPFATTSALLGPTSPGENLTPFVDLSGSQSAHTKVVVGAVVGTIAGATLLLACLLLLWRRRRPLKRQAPAVPIRASFLPRLSQETDVPLKRPPLKLATSSSPTVHHITPFTQRPASSAPTSPQSPSNMSPMDLLRRSMNPGRLSTASTVQGPPNSALLSPTSPSTQVLRKAASSTSLISTAPSAYPQALRSKTSAISLHSLASNAPGPACVLHPLVIPPVQARATTPGSAVSPNSGILRAASPGSGHVLDLLAGEDHSPGVTRYAADVLIQGWDTSRPVRYEVEEDGGAWSENVVRLPPRYSTVHPRNTATAPAADAHATVPDATPE